MAVIPGGTQFVGVNSDVDMSEKKSSQVNSTTQIYTLQDFEDSLSPDLTPITVDGNSVSIAKDSTATTQDTAVIQSSDTNAGIAIVPNGTGAITAQVPDGTLVGGNARGDYAVDLQRGRQVNSRVSSGNYSAIFGGYDNTASGDYSISGGRESRATVENSISIGKNNNASGTQSLIIGGNNNVASATHSSVIGGGNNNVSGAYSIASGASNTVSSNYSTISGGQNNTASTNSHATVVGGSGNTSSGQYSVSGGISNIASGRGSVALGGNNVGNNATFNGAVAIGEGNTSSAFFSASFGENNTSSGNSSFVCGTRGIGTFTSFVFSSREGAGFANGKSQVCTYIRNNNSQGGGNLSLLSGGTTNVGRLVTNTDNSSANVKTQIIMQVIGITGTVTGISVGDSWARNDELVIRRLSGAYTIRGTVAKGTYNGDSSLALSDFDYSLIGNNIDMIFTAPTFSGGGEIELRVVCKIEMVETGF